jgi:hypothetical protein
VLCDKVRGEERLLILKRPVVRYMMIMIMMIYMYTILASMYELASTVYMYLTPMLCVILNCDSLYYIQSIILIISMIINIITTITVTLG